MKFLTLLAALSMAITASNALAAEQAPKKAEQVWKLDGPMPPAPRELKAGEQYGCLPDAKKGVWTDCEIITVRFLQPSQSLQDAPAPDARPTSVSSFNCVYDNRGHRTCQVASVGYGAPSQEQVPQYDKIDQYYRYMGLAREAMQIARGFQGGRFYPGQTYSSYGSTRFGTRPANNEWDVKCAASPYC